MDTLVPQKDSFIEEDFRESFSDLLFKANIGGRGGYVYFLFEHKSTPSPAIAYQLLKYMVAIWGREIDENTQLPIIMPLVIYQGRERWNVGTAFRDLVQDYGLLPGIMPYVLG